MNKEEVTRTEKIAVEILKLETAKKRISDEIKDIKKEAKSDGVEIQQVMNALKTLRRILKDEEMKLSEEEFLVEKFEKNVNIVNLIQELLE